MIANNFNTLINNIVTVIPPIIGTLRDKLGHIIIKSSLQEPRPRACHIKTFSIVSIKSIIRREGGRVSYSSINSARALHDFLQLHHTL